MQSATPMNTATVTRRSALHLAGLGITAATLTAACSRSSEGDDADNEFHAAYPYSPPPQGNFNLLGGVSNQISIGYLGDLIMAPGATYLWADRTYYYLLADERSVMSPDGLTFHYHLKTDQRWSDGTPITADDLYTTWLLRWANGHTVFSNIKDMRKTGDHTVTFHMRQPSPSIEYFLLRERLVSHGEFAQWSRRAEPLFREHRPTSDEAVIGLVRDVSSYKPERAIVSGPFNFDYDQIANGSLLLTKNSEGHRAKHVPFDRIQVYNGETEVITPILLDQGIDYATHGIPRALEKGLIANGYRMIKTPSYSGHGVLFNFHTLPEFGDKRVRQALAHTLDRPQSALGHGGRASQYLSGMSDLHVPVWVTADGQRRLNPYEHDHAKATRLLQEAGWRKDGDTWITPQGNAAAYDLLYPNDYIGPTAGAESVADQLTEFGIKITRRGVESTLYFEQVERGRFQLAQHGWGASTNPFPAASYRSLLIDNNYPGLAPDRGMDFPLSQHTDAIGDIDFEDTITSAEIGANIDAIRPTVTRLALAYNELLPLIPLAEYSGNNPMLEERITGWPSNDDPITRNSPYADNFVTILMYQGRLKAT